MILLFSGLPSSSECFFSIFLSFDCVLNAVIAWLNSRNSWKVTWTTQHEVQNRSACELALPKKVSETDVEVKARTISYSEIYSQLSEIIKEKSEAEEQRGDKKETKMEKDRWELTSVRRPAFKFVTIYRNTFSWHVKLCYHSIYIAYINTW